MSTQSSYKNRAKPNGATVNPLVVSPCNVYNRNLIEASLDPLVTIGSNGKITDVNKATEKVTGFPRRILIGTDFSDYFTEPDKARKGYKQVFSKGFVRDYPLIIKHKSGRLADVLYNATVYKNEAGEVEGVFAVARDVTALKEAEQELQESEKELREAQRVAKVGNWDWDASTDAITWSEEYYRIYGLDPKKKPPGYEEHLKVYTPESAARLDEAVKRNMETGEPYEIDLEIAKPGGPCRWITARSETKRDKAGRIIGLRGTAQDITERKSNEERITRLSRVYSVLSKVNEAIIRIEDRQRLFDEVCRIVVDVGLMRMAWIGLVDPETDLVDVASSRGFIDGYLDSIRISTNVNIKEGRGPTGTAIRTREHFVCRDIKNDPHMAVWRKKALDRGYLSSAAFPLVIDYCGIGALNIYAGEKDCFNKEETSLYDELAADLSFALRSLQIEQRQRKAEYELQASEQRYHNLFKNMLEGLAYCRMIYDKQGNPVDWIYLEVNESFTRITGLEDVIGRKVTELLPGIDVTNPELFQIYDRVGKTGVARDFETWVKPINEWMRVSVFSPEKHHFVAVFEDITKRKLAEQTCQANEERLRSIIDAAPFGAHLYELEEDGRLIYLSGNKSADRILGVDCNEFIGLTLEEAFPGKIGTKLPDMYRRAAATGQPYSVPQISYDVNGKNYVFEVHATQTSPDHVVSFFRDTTETTRARRELEISHGLLEESFIGLIKALSATVETRDPYTALHQKRVTELAMAIASEAGLPAEETEGLYMAGLIHDIGKIYVPGEILSKPGKLSDVEIKLVRTHSDAGYKIIEGIKFKRPVADIVHQHHERLDGSGYPGKLKEKDILPEAKILAVADVVEAMASHRPYRPALGIDAALAELKKNRGRLYDVKIVDSCIKLFTDKGFAFTD